MKVTVTIEQDGKRFEGSASSTDTLDANLRRAKQIAVFEMERRPGCTCEAKRPVDERCNGTTMRCQGAIDAHLAAKGPVAAIEVPGAKGNEGAHDDCS